MFRKNKKNKKVQNGKTNFKQITISKYKMDKFEKKKINNERKNYERIVGLIGWLIMFEPNEKIANNFKVFVIQKLTKLFMVVKKKISKLKIQEESEDDIIQNIKTLF